jgi:short-subunit dehydrogenase
MQEFFSKNKLAQKRALITGGNSGIGLATARLLAGYGVKLYIAGRDQVKLDKALEDIQNLHSDAEVYAMSVDLAKGEDVRSLFDSVVERFGGLDILINNAGIGYGSVLEGKYADWEYIVKTNLLNYMACSSEAAKLMEKEPFGNIIHVGSMSAESRDAESSVYVATKTALQGFCEAFRKEVNEKQINVTLIEPGAVATPMQPMPDEEKQQKIKDLEMLHADDVAMSILYTLCQPERCSIVDLKLRPLMQMI